MVSYINRNSSGGVRRVEFAPAADGHFAFLSFNDAAEARQFGATLEQMPVGQHVVAETQLDGKPVLVTQGKASGNALLEQLRASGNDLAPEVKKARIDPWVVRSVLGIGGQSLQLASSFMRPPREGPKTFWGSVDTGTLVFAASNLTANGINLIYKSQEVDDPHRLRFLKQQINDIVGPRLSSEQTLISVDEKRAAPLYDSGKPPASNRFQSFMQRNSVNVGELGLRYLGAFGLAYPARGWPNMLNGQLPKRSDYPLRYAAGMTSVVGKTVALASTIPDPYNPAPEGFIGKLRSHYSFIAGGIIEAAAFTGLAVDSFKTGPEYNKSGIQFRGKHMKDWLGVVGASMFVVGYITRLFAKYGTRHVDMRELYAHAGQTLAKVPDSELPKAVADVAANLTGHFKGEDNLDYSTVYSNLYNELCRYKPRALTAPAPANSGPASPPEPQVDAVAHAGRITAAPERALAMA